MDIHTLERDSRPEFDDVKIKSYYYCLLLVLLLLLLVLLVLLINTKWKWFFITYIQWSSAGCRETLARRRIWRALVWRARTCGTPGARTVARTWRGARGTTRCLAAHRCRTSGSWRGPASTAVHSCSCSENTCPPLDATCKEQFHLSCHWHCYDKSCQP